MNAGTNQEGIHFFKIITSARLLDKEKESV
jgi:hypothetical protein